MDYKEIFDRYLDGKLTGDELRKFEELLRKDPVLADELDKYKKLHAVAEEIVAGESADQQAKDDIADFRQQDTEQDIDLQNFRQALKKAGRRRISPFWYAAAVTIVTVITLAIILLLNSKTEMNELYARYYEPYHQSERIFEITRSNDDLYFAVQLFEAGDYSRASLLFNQLADSTGLTRYARFYSGLIYIHQEKWELAIESFMQVIACGASDVLNDARWYLGLCYLRVENPSTAREQFEMLSMAKNEYSKRARKIIRHMD
jgi:tetratricopeptide (TPR) repeat protein